MDQITHNNNGQHYRIAIDIAKEGSELFDLTSYFKGRVGDNRFGLQVVWSNMGSLLDTQGQKPFIQGQVGLGSIDDNKMLQMAPDASTVSYTGKPEDCGPNGQVTYYFPEQMFPKEGYFKGFIGLIDDSDGSGKARYSGVNIWFRVLDGVATMGKAAQFYISDLDAAIANSKEELRQALDTQDETVQNWIKKNQQAIQDALAAINDPKTGLWLQYQHLLEIGNQVKELFQNGEFHQKANQYNTIADMQADSMLMAGDTAIVKGSENYNDGKGGVYAIRVKRTEDNPDGVHLIALPNGTMAEMLDSITTPTYLKEHGIYPNAGTHKLGTAHLTLGDDRYPVISARIYQYGAGVPQPEGVDIAGGTASYDVGVRAVRIDPETVDIYLSPEHYRDYFSGYHLDSPEANCGGDSAYLSTGINCLQIQAHGATVDSFDVVHDFEC